MELKNPSQKEVFSLNPTSFTYNNKTIKQDFTINTTTTTTNSVVFESTILSLTPTSTNTLDLPHPHKQKLTNTSYPRDPDQYSSTPSPRSSKSQEIMFGYKECQRNHAAHLGSHAVDGCGEFMPAGDEGTPQAFLCAACDCHRNFHRREVDGEPLSATPPAVPPVLLTNTGTTPAANNNTTPVTTNCYISFNNNNQHKITPRPNTIQQCTNNRIRHSSVPVMVAFGGGGAAAESSSEDLNAYRAAEIEGQLMAQSRKRFRTKFTQEQKDQMMEFADKIGWKIKKQDEAQVQQLCTELGIKRQVFKVWMHNNKQAMKRKHPENG